MVAILTLNGQILDANPSEMKPVDRTTAGIKADHLMLFPSARMIEQYLHAIPEGESRDIPTMRRELAARHGALTTNPETTRKHLLAIAEATFDAFDDCALLRELTPVWRVLDERAGSLLDELSFEPAFLLDLRDSERSHPMDTGKQAA